MSKNKYKAGQIYEYYDTNDGNISKTTYQVLGSNCVNNIKIKIIDTTRYSRYKKGENDRFMSGSFMDGHSILVKDVEPEKKEDDKLVNKFKVGQIYRHKDESNNQDSILEIRSVFKYPHDDNYSVQFSRIDSNKDSDYEDDGSFDAGSNYARHCTLIRIVILFIIKEVRS